MVEYFAKWRSELDQPAKVAASEGYEGYGVPMAVDGSTTPANLDVIWGMSVYCIRAACLSLTC